MRLITLFVASALIAAPALAQQTQRSSNPQGVQIQGNTEIKADQKNVVAVAVGEGNTAKNTAGAQLRVVLRFKVTPRSMPHKRMQLQLQLARTTKQLTKLA